MAKVTFILGLSGSGKTYFAKELLKQSPAVFYDEGFMLDIKHNYKSLISYLRDGKDCIIIDMEFRSQHNRKIIQRMLQTDIPEAAIAWIFFENDIKKATENIKKRTTNIKEHMEINERNTTSYEIPEDVVPLPIITAWE